MTEEHELKNLICNRQKINPHIFPGITLFHTVFYQHSLRYIAIKCYCFLATKSIIKVK